MTTCSSGTYAGETVYCDPTPDSNSGYLIIGKVGQSTLLKVFTVVRFLLQGWAHATIDCLLCHTVYAVLDCCRTPMTPALLTAAALAVRCVTHTT